MPNEPVDPFTPPYPPTRKSPVPFTRPVEWRTHDGATYWIIDRDLIYPLGIMPLARAQRLLTFLNDQAETDLVAAFRDLPMLAAVRRHIDRLTADQQ